jgi:hypothetical protein
MVPFICADQLMSYFYWHGHVHSHEKIAVEVGGRAMK